MAALVMMSKLSKVESDSLYNFYLVQDGVSKGIQYPYRTWCTVHAGHMNWFNLYSLLYCILAYPVSETVEGKVSLHRVQIDHSVRAYRLPETENKRFRKMSPPQAARTDPTP